MSNTPSDNKPELRAPPDDDNASEPRRETAPVIPADLTKRSGIKPS
jgi:hypothetical protein